MNSDPVIINTPENPQTLREVGIYLGAITKALEELKSTQKSQHIENIDKLNEIKDSYPTRVEFESYKLEYKENQVDHETRIRKLEWLVWIGMGGLYVINVIIGFWLLYRH